MKRDFKKSNVLPVGEYHFENDYAGRALMYLAPFVEDAGYIWKITFNNPRGTGGIFTYQKNDQMKDVN